MPYPGYQSPTSPPGNRYRDSSPTKPSPLRHTVSTRSNTSDTENSSLPSRQDTIFSNASAGYSQGSTGAYSSYDSDPFVTSNSSAAHKRPRAESPVKKNAAFAKWEQREQAEQDQPTPRPAEKKMDISPRKIKDDDWRSGLGRSESRSALRSVELNTRSDGGNAIVKMPRELGSPSKENHFHAPLSPSRDGIQSSHRSSPHARGHSLDTTIPSLTSSAPPSTPETIIGHRRGGSKEASDTQPTSILASRNSLATLSRSDSIRASTKPRERGHVRFGSQDAAPHLDGEDLAKLQKSSTPQLRHLSKLASEGSGEEDLSVHSPEEQVAGLAGRRRLQRAGSVKPSAKTQSRFGSQFASTRWMDTQRKHLQAYEYLCHIGEARAWLEDVLEPIELPPIVQLEEALRDGVNLAEVVVRLGPSLPSEQQKGLGSLRIFRNARLQYRHTDNIAMFFRFLGEVELPELFRFETVDLYEKKNIPKVIYCIHALSWLLYRKGVVQFRIGNLVGQLQFEEHELEETQKGIDRSGVAMPNFGGMREAMQVEPEPEPDPTPEEMLAEHEEMIVDLQSQIRGAIQRLRLGQVMQDLWDVEESVAHFEAIARAGFARAIFNFKFGMDNSTRQFQAAAKGFLVRRQMHRKQRAWRDNKQAVTKVQSLWRGRQQRAQTKTIQKELRTQRHGLKELQAAIRGALGRWRAGDLWHETHSPEAESDVAALQAQARGALERLQVGALMNALWDVEPTIELLQATIRGGRIRDRAKGQKRAVNEAAIDVVRLQAAARAMIQRKIVERHHCHFKVHEGGVVEVQAAARGLLQRLQQARTKGALQGRETGIARLQSAIRAHLQGKRVKLQKAELLTQSTSITQLQALVKANAYRQWMWQLRQELKQHEAHILDLQALARAMLERRRIGTQLGNLEDEEEKITTLQSLARAYLQRQRVFDQLVEMERDEDSITQLQAFARAMLERSRIGELLAEVEDHEDAIVALQANARAHMVRAKFEEKRKFFHENMQKVVKLQSFVRAKQQGESYKSLVGGKNPPLPVVRRHLHLLTDTNLEFESELEAERLRRQVVESVRRNELVEGYVEGLDVKIALLVKNKITLDEVVKHQKHFGGSATQLLRQGTLTGPNSNGGFDLKALNKNSRKKLMGYEELFFMLQTQPQYMSRLLQVVSSRGLAEKEGKNLERLVMTLFGNAQKHREEYFLLKLLNTCTQQLISQAQTLDDHLRQQSGSFHQRLALNYVRTPMVRIYLKTLLGPIVKEGICAQDHLDLESDPLQIYRAILNNEELSTGRPSRRPRDIPAELAIREHDVRPTYVQHLEHLRDLCDSFFVSLQECLHRMPYGVRYMVTSQYHALCQQFPHEDQGYLAVLAGHWLWKTYLLPALKEPEMWGVVDRGLNPIHKRNLQQVILALSQVASGRLFGPENLYMQPLNTWITESLDRWHDAMHAVFDLPPAEEYFDADQFSDLYARTKPTLYIKLADIFALHSMVSDNLPAMGLDRGDPIKELLTDLGTAKSNESDLSSASSGGEITLTLKSRFTIQDDPNAEARQLFMATKRLVLYTIKVQTGNNLMEILCRPISHDDADKWVQVIREEQMEKERQQGNKHPGHRRVNSGFDPRSSLRGGRAQSVYSESPSTYSASDGRTDLLDLESMTYAELKRNALENIIALSKPDVPPQFRVSQHNNYQDILNALAADIRQKHRRRLDRQREIESTRATLAQLDEKAHFLEDQLKSYNDYIEQCLHTLANKKGTKHKFILPFTKQWSHERELEKAGRQPKFGSYKYSARQLADKGVLLAWHGYAPEHWGQLDVVISSDEVGVFHLEASAGSMMLPGGSANLLLDELLQAQYEGRLEVRVFEEMSGGGARLSTNLLLHRVFKKFYRDE
ncbi:RasGAP C-terminus [Teratosphaeria destructans]|uniref:RasGAP C-terminus n=1 Tax=Teratosphaeria destructans TaxID=418781 RepID=A0A9W7STI3_9PEZI|nr:RasGAP C-terminus [Teratosphaeria destructans]